MPFFGRNARVTRSSRYRQRGDISLVGLTLTATISMMMAGAALWGQRQDMLSDLRKSQGQLLFDIGNGYNSFIVNHYAALVGGTAVSGVTNPYAPTIAEIQATGDLPTSYQPTSVSGLPYIASLQKTPASCTGGACNITGLVCVNGAITDPSTGQPQPLGDAVAGVGADGLASDSISPGTLMGRNGALIIANPLGNVAGTLCMQVGYNTSGWSQFVRKDGSVAMEGDLNFRGTDGTRHDVANAATVNAQKVVAAAGGNVQIGSSTYYGDGSNSAIYQTGSLYLQHPGGAAADIALVGNINSAGTVTAAGAQINGGANVTGDTNIGGQVSIGGNTIMGANTQIYNPGTQYIETGGGNLYLKPWNNGGVTVVGGGGGSGQLLTTGRLTSNEYIQPNGLATAGVACAPNGLIATSGSGPLFCQNGVWGSANASWHNAWTYIGAGGGVDTNAWIPGALMVQITAYAGAGNTSNGGHSGGNVAYATVDGTPITQVWFDTSGAEDGMYITGNMMVTAGYHTLAGTGGSSSTYGNLSPSFYISGYLQ